ncbi:hypothetical protein AOA80_03580 [Methanomassiliicoccales archaeon RumEn M1]|nr:hypothetical protein AOA80_03580 [Methanomassiliicoccales archaeon RumEn M1]
MAFLSTTEDWVLLVAIATLLVTLYSIYLEVTYKREMAEELDQNAVNDCDVLVKGSKWAWFKAAQLVIGVRGAWQVHIIVGTTFPTEIIYSLAKGDKCLRDFAPAQDKQYLKKHKVKVSVPLEEVTLTVQITPRRILPCRVRYFAYRVQPSNNFIGTVGDMFRLNSGPPEPPYPIFRS